MIELFKELNKFIEINHPFENHNSCHDVNIRKEYVKLVEDVRDGGGEVKIFSSMHISGQRKYYSLNFKRVFPKWNHVIISAQQLGHSLKHCMYDLYFGNPVLALFILSHMQSNTRAPQYEYRYIGCLISHCSCDCMPSFLTTIS